MRYNEIILGGVVIVFCNVTGFFLRYISKTYIFRLVTFQNNLDSLGSSLVTYSTTMMALLIAMIVIIFGLDGPRFDAFKKGGYLHATYFIYMITFFELGLTMAFSLLCLSNISNIFNIQVASYSLTFAFITFLLIGFLAIQLLRIKKNL